MRIALLLSAALFSISALGADDINTLAAEINAAHKAHDYPAMEADANKLLDKVPGYPFVIYLLAVAREGRGDGVGALAALNQLADMGLYFDVRKGGNFTALQASREFAALEARFAANRKPMGKAAAAFRLTEPDFIPEGLTHDPASGDFFVGSVHLRKILRVHGNTVSTFATRESGLWSVMALRADPARGALWAVSEALPQMQDYAAKLEGKSALLRFDLHSGALEETYVASDGGAHGFNDLTVAPDGSVYVADDSGGVYALAPGAKALKALTPAGALLSSQGLALSANGRYLYIADYGAGLYAYDLVGDKLSRLNAPADVATFGVDGLYLYGHDLVATQNGVEPQRVIRYRLDSTGLAISSDTLLDANDPLVPEPTLISVAGDTLYMVANAQWSRFDDQNHLPANGQLQVPLIAQLPLR
ncbi:MAG: SMP-30/gluconolactonase/LRE family protein [Gammaproteobacteria bacterium]